jgi:hypothetical protein
LTVDLAHCCAAQESQRGGRVAIGRLSLLSDGKPIPLLIAAREGATGSKLLGLDQALEVAGYAHLVGGITRINEYLARHPDQDAVPRYEWQADAEAIRKAARAVPSVRTTLARDHAPKSSNVESLAGEEVRAFVEAAGLSAVTAPAIREERKRAIRTWVAAAKKVDTRLFPYASFRKGIENVDIKIGQLEELLGESATQKEENRRMPGMVERVLRKNARDAGRSAMQNAILDDLEKLLSARKFAVESYTNLFDADIWRLVNAEDRKLLMKYGLLKKDNPLRDPKLKK